MSRRRDRETRNAIRDTWCRVAAAINDQPAAASVIARFFVGLDDAYAVPEPDDVSVVLRKDEPAAVPFMRLYPLLRWRDWASRATHFLAPDDDAFPFLDRITHELARGTSLSAPKLGVGHGVPVRLEKTFVCVRGAALLNTRRRRGRDDADIPSTNRGGRPRCDESASPVVTRDHSTRRRPAAAPPRLRTARRWGYFMAHPDFGPWPFAAGFGKLLTADLARALANANSTVPFEFRHDCPKADASIQGNCVKDTFIYEDNFLGLLLAPYAYGRRADSP